MASGPTYHVTYKLRDKKNSLVEAWKRQFSSVICCSSQPRVEVSRGDIFEEAPAADAIVSPGNSFGFMDGGIEQIYTDHFGWQMPTRLQEVIRNDFNGELLVGQAAVISSYVTDRDYDAEENAACNEGKPIRWLICAPTMRVPLDVSSTANAYLAFRAVLLAVKKHNSDPLKSRISSVLCPGLGTAAGHMPADRCAFQMKEAFRVYDQEEVAPVNVRSPRELGPVWNHHITMAEYKSPSQ